MSDLYLLGRKLTELGNEGMGGDVLGLAPGEFLVLRDLYQHGTSSISDCVARTHLAQSRVSTVVQTLKDRGWAQTRPDPDDGRRTLVEVTEYIKLEAARRQPQGPDTLQAALASCPTKERASLIAALERLHEILVANDIPHGSS